MKKNLKKVLATGLVASMVMGISVPAFAYTAGTAKNGVEIGKDSNGQVIYAQDEGTVTITKYYKEINEGTVSPEETFTFTSKKGATIVNEDGESKEVYFTDSATDMTVDTMPALESVVQETKYDAGAATTGTGASKNIIVTLPEYTSVGVYYYTINEIQQSTAGVDYYTDDIVLVVTVIQDQETDSDGTKEGKVRVAAVHCESPFRKDTKTGYFTNTYSAGDLSITKTVTGNMGDQEKYFDVTVTFTAPTITIDDKAVFDTVKEDITYSGGTITEGSISKWTESDDGKYEASTTIRIKHGDTVTFKNIPYGVEYSVVEADYTKNDDGTKNYDAPQYANKEYASEVEEDQIIYTEITENVVNNIADSPLEKVTITNNKGTEIDTGIALDALPYLMMLGMSGLGALGLAGKKRKEEDEI